VCCGGMQRSVSRLVQALRQAAAAAPARPSVRWHRKLTNWTPSPLCDLSFRAQARGFRTTTPCFSQGIAQHRDTADNNPSTPFEWTAESLERIKFVLKKFPSNYRQSAVIGLLYIAQEQNDNWISLSAMNKVAETLDMPAMRVYEVASFYTMFNRTPVGKHHLQVCGTTPCQLCGAEEIISTLETHLDVDLGETTEDGMFTLSEVECLGACVNAPMMQVNNQHFYEYLTPESVVRLVDDLRHGRQVKTNNQNHVFTCEGLQGQTTLQNYKPPAQPLSRDFDVLKAELAKKAKEEAEKKAKDEAEKKAKEAAAKAAAPGGAEAAKK